MDTQNFGSTEYEIWLKAFYAILASGNHSVGNSAALADEALREALNRKPAYYGSDDLLGQDLIEELYPRDVTE